MSEHPAIEYYRANRRVVEALQLSRCTSELDASEESNIECLLTGNVELKELERSLGELNIFAALGVSEKEIRHSRVLAWLLDPGGSHGRSTHYLERFLALVCEQSA